MKAVTKSKLPVISNGLPSWSSKNPPTNAGNVGSISGPERFHMLWDNKAHSY